MVPSIPILLAFVCSIFGTTSELTNYDPNAVSLNIHWNHSQQNNKYIDNIDSRARQHDSQTRVKRETSGDPRCKPFEYKEGFPIRHPQELGTKKPEDGFYSSNTTCFTSIKTGEGKVIELTFVNKFELEDPVTTDEGPSCKHDYIEIRDGQFGYALTVWKFCGKEFPPTISSTGPFLWLKFKSDDSIQYSGFEIEVEFQTNVQSKITPEDCFMSITKQTSGVIDSREDAKKCRASTTGPAVDFQWKIETDAGTQIYLNFILYKLAKPNECDMNIVQVFGAEPNLDHELGSFCGSVAKSVTTSLKKANSNVMYIRMYTKDKMSNVTAQFTAYRTLAQGEEECNEATEFNCLDGTCINKGLKCNGVANCRMKADEDPAICTTALASPENNPQMIMIVFSVILSIMITVFIVKCVLKVYRDQKQIKEHMLLHGGLDKLSETNLSFDPMRMTMEPDPRASLERDNYANEMYKQHRNRHTSSSIESDFLRESTTPEHSEWPESVPILPEDVRIEHKGRTRGDGNKRQETLRTPNGGWAEKRTVSFEAPDTQESGCQTRDSLFQVDPVPSSVIPGPNSRVPSGAARPSSLRLSTPASPPPARPMGFAVGPIGSHSDRRPMSNETTRSAPDVIIVSKPIN